MTSKNKIVVYGGSFNPPHNLHFSIAQQALNQFEDIEKVIFVPVNKKYAKDGLEENIHRYHMLKIVTDQNESFETSDIDMNNNQSLPMIEILDLVQKKYKEKEICFLIGSDNLKELHTWVRAEELISKYHAIVKERDHDDIEEIVNVNDILNRNREHIYQLNRSVKSNISSTYLRTQMKRGNSIRYLVPDEVYYYIQNNNLYKE